jgi:anhydro-N-acetylmuramic acid kinase
VTGSATGPGPYFIGLMSGTSLDAVDGVLAAFPPTDGTATANGLRTLAFDSLPLPDPLRATLMALQAPGHDELARAATAGNALADGYAAVVAQLLARTGLPASAITAIGAHGQTVRHRPESGWTIQLLGGARLAELTGIDVVCDLRSADVAAGGQGAPLVPAFHADVFDAPGERRVIVNIGGIANVSLLAGDGTTAGHDTGPGNLLMDGWIARHRNLPFDADGRWAAGAEPDGALLATLQADPYFARTPPKSTGRDDFHLEWLDDRLRGLTHPPEAQSVQSTLCELTAWSIAQACAAHRATEVFVCGGGARNTELMRRIATRIAPAALASTAALGIDPQSVEALAFAWLAQRRVSRRPGNLPAVTGARGPRVLGALYPAS